MEIEAPTFNSLNKPQKRALILRDQLRYVQPHHLDTFIEGITDDEPPTYRKINGTIQPPLALVYLKDAAIRFDLGNVLFPEENNAVHRAYLTVEDDHIEMRTEEALPKDDANLDSVAIHGFIAGTMVPMFKNKFQIILARMNKINEARRAAYNKPYEAPALFQEGETLARLDPVKAEQNRNSSLSRKIRKRKPGEPVAQHTSNKRKRMGLDTIPENVKSATFNTVPDQIKVDLFNNIVKTAFPNFDNLMMASWNVISIYSACGSDFPELHRAIVDLKDVLQDFDEAFGSRVNRTAPKYRHDFAGSPQNDLNGSRLLLPAPTATQNGAGTMIQANGGVSNGPAQQQDDTDAAVDSTEDHTDEVQHNMPPPHTLQMNPHQGDEEEEEEEEQRPLNPRLNGRLDRRSSSHQSNPQYMPENQLQSASIPNSNHSSPAPQPIQLPRERPKKPRDPNSDTHAEDRSTLLSQPTPELTRRREEYASSIGKANLHSAGAAKVLFGGTDDISLPTSSPSPQDLPQTPDQQSTTHKKKKSFSEYTTAQLRQKRQERKAHLIKTFGSMLSVPQQHMTQLQQLEQALKTREQAEKEGSVGSGMSGTFLGNSVLGAKKTGTGMAPVAPMLHNRKDSNGDRNGSGGGSGAGRRVY